MKVLHIFKAMEIGGVPMAVWQLTSSLSRNKVYCEIVTTCELKFLNSNKPSCNVKTHVFSTQFPACWWPGYSSTLSRFLKANIQHFDLIHIHGLWNYTGYTAACTAQQYNIPYILSLHGALLKPALQRYTLRKYIYLMTIQKPILCSASAIHYLTNQEKIEAIAQKIEAPSFILPNGVNPNIYNMISNTDPVDFLSQNPSLTGKRIILFMGRLVFEKSPDILVGDFLTIAQRFPNVVLLMAGPHGRDKMRIKIETMLRKMSSDIQERVIFTGPLSGYEWRAAYASAEIFVLPSRGEGFCLALLEAMTVELPVVVSARDDDSNEIYSLIKNENAGIIVPQKKEALTEAIIYLLSNKQRAKQMAQNGRRLALNYNWSSIADSMAAHYSEIIARHVPRQA